MMHGQQNIKHMDALSGILKIYKTQRNDFDKIIYVMFRLKGKPGVHVR
jgi:hypothetical protein